MSPKVQAESTPSAAPAEKAEKEKKGHASGDRRFKALDMTMKRCQYKPDALIEVLHKAQEAFGFLEEDVLIYVARGLKLPLSKVYGVATFYHLFSLKPNGAHTCVVCMGTACYVKGSNKVLEILEQELGVKVGETTPDGQVSLMAARCLGACGIAPAVVFDGTVAGKLEPEAALAKVQAWETP
ncbi:MAG: bidirectional hydrogenase complex protein HoxE [Leptolyngbyaceae cyanobacterium bins.59]|nr:bidirectional hydrogenase complex protein HoxE [Leptolyngbyaceae cyanobacterium bins.59]